jgi:hypothetical protein
MSVDV